MSISNVRRAEESLFPEQSSSNYVQNSTNDSAISWGAIFAGAVAAAVLSLMLLVLGAGLGLSSVSPWAQQGVSASVFGISTIVWLSITQIIASGMGGYLAGRLRSRWPGVQIDEVYFRDTAHGFLAWAVASLATAVLLTSVIGAVVNTGAQAAATLAGGAASAAITSTITDNANQPASNELGYIVDSLFRSNTNLTATNGNVAATDSAQQSKSNIEVTRILMNALDKKGLPEADISYIGQLISSNTGLNQQEAEQRVKEIYTGMQTQLANAELTTKNAAEKARKASFYAALWLFVSLLMGAFSASLAATWGGRCRDA